MLCWFFTGLFTFITIPFWLDIVLYDSPATVPKVNLLIHDTRVPSHTVYTQSILDALPGTWQNPRCLSDEHIVTAWTCFFRLKVAELFLTPLGTMYFIFSTHLQVKLLCCRRLYARLLPHSAGFATLKTSTDPDIYTCRFLASSLQDSDNTISVFFRCWETNWIMNRSLHKQLSKRRQLF